MFVPGLAALLVSASVIVSAANAQETVRQGDRPIDHDPTSGQARHPETTASPELILLNGRILTVDGSDSVAQAIAIAGGRILAVGTDSDIRARAAKSTRIVDLHGRTATPGLIDSHAHIAEGGLMQLTSVELSKATSIAQVRKLIATRAATLKKDEWLLGQGWDEGKLSERRYIVAHDLDDLTPSNPVWLEHTTGHYGVANTVALHLAGIDSKTPTPAAGTIDRDPSGQPTGVLKEDPAMLLVTHLIPVPTAEQRRDGILASIDLMHREGMTAVKDPALEPAQWEAYESLDKSGQLGAHVCILWRAQPNLEAVRALLAKIRDLPKPPQPMHANLISCGVKFFMDGSGGARTAWMYQDWNKHGTELDTGNKGYPSIDPEVYRQAVRLLHGADIHVATHAIGDRAIDWVVDTYAAVLKERPTRTLRHAIIHANTPTDHAIDVMAALQRDFDSGYPETQAPFAWWIGDNYAGNLGPVRTQRLNPYHTYLTHGIRWAGGSDYPVTPLPARYGLWASVARTTLLGVYGQQPFGTAEAVDARTALKSYTIWAAHQLFLEKEAGSIEVGKSADIAVWDRDPTTVATGQLKDLVCELTLFRGKVVYRATGSPITGLP